MKLNNFAIYFCLIGCIINIIFKIIFNDNVYLIYACLLSTLACFNYIAKIEKLINRNIEIQIITNMNSKKIAKAVKEIKK